MTLRKGNTKPWKAMQDYKKAKQGHTRPKQVAQGYAKSYKAMLGLTWPQMAKKT